MYRVFRRGNLEDTFLAQVREPTDVIKVMNRHNLKKEQVRITRVNFNQHYTAAKTR